MRRLSAVIRGLVRDEAAATMVEYALMVALIAAVCVIAVTALGINLNAVFSNGALAAAL